MRRVRGVSILEVMIAGAILLVALMGIVLMLLRGANASRSGEVAVNASMYAQDLLTESQANGYLGLSAGVFDAGEVFDLNGRRYGRLLDVTVGDAGYDSYEVQAIVDYASSDPPPFQKHYRTMASTVISRMPDAN